jgi:hypothetical protein
MAVEEAATEIFDHEVPGAIKCKSPGCPNWFMRAGNRHRYCKAENCTYRRGAALAREVQEAGGASLELLLRLQDEESGEVGPDLLGARRVAVQEALRAGDLQALFGALVDEATACVWFADRAAAGKLPRRLQIAGPPPFAGMQAPAQRPVGLAQAVLSSHKRTFYLAEKRCELLWRMLDARDEQTAAEVGVAATAGGIQEPEAQENLELKRVAYAQAEAAYTAIEMAWRERAIALRDLSGAVESAAGPSGPGPSGPRALAA